MNIGKSLNQYYLSEWSNQEEKQRQSMLNISIPGGLPENPRNETDIEQRNLNFEVEERAAQGKRTVRKTDA